MRKKLGIVVLLIMLMLFVADAGSTANNIIEPSSESINIAVPVVKDRLNSGETLNLGESIKSPNGQYIFRLQNDGNFVLYKVASPTDKILWTSKTKNPYVWDVTMYEGGELVIEDSEDYPIWSTPTGGNPGAYLQLQNDGNAVIYRAKGVALWRPNTAQTPPPPPPPPPSSIVGANRIIDKMTLTAGSETGITVTLKNDGVIRAFSLKETMPSTPSVWTITRVSDNANEFKASTNEWAWLAVASNAVKTVKYNVKVPPSTKPGTYYISGYMKASGVTINVKGDNTIYVVQGDILAYYRGLNVYPNIVETVDLLRAADDWIGNIVPPGFSVPITTQQLLTLADEWRVS